MKKLTALVLVVVVVLSCVSFVACGGGEGNGGAPPATGETTPADGGNGAPGDGNGAPAGEDLEEILGLGAGIDTVYYDMIISAPGTPTMTMHMWVKHNKIRAEMTEQEQTMVMLIDYDEGVMYMYMPDQNMAYEMPLSQAPESALEEAQAIADYDYHVIGTATEDGKVCLVVEYTVEGVSGKMWVWKEHGFPIKIETTTPEGKTVIEFRNISFADIDDSMFELPPGVQIM
jgi:outer membrane lipoprotein-sorting protein